MKDVLKSAENYAESATNNDKQQEEQQAQRKETLQGELPFPVDNSQFTGRDDVSTEYETLTTQNGSVPSAFGEASGDPRHSPPRPDFQFEIHSPSQHDSLLTGLNEQFKDTEDRRDQHSLPRRANSEEQARLGTVVRLKAWLQEVERDAATHVNLVDQHKIRHTASKIQNFIDEMVTHRLEVGRIIDVSDDKLVVNRAGQCAQEMDRLIQSCQRRKNELTEMLHQSKMWVFKHHKYLIRIFIEAFKCLGMTKSFRKSSCG